MTLSQDLLQSDNNKMGIATNGEQLPRASYGKWNITLNIAAHALAITMFGTVLYDQKMKGNPVCCEYKSPGLHPVLMTLAFGWLGPWGALAYKTYEHMLGLSHLKAKIFHFILQTLALGFGWFGFVSKYEGSDVHFRSLHSQMGIGVLALYSAQWLVGVTTFLFNIVPQSFKPKVAVGHAFVGSTSMVLSFATIYTGILSYVGKTTDQGDDFRTFDRLNTTAFLSIILGMLVMYLLGQKKMLSPDRAQLLNDTKKNSGGKKSYQVVA